MTPKKELQINNQQYLLLILHLKRVISKCFLCFILKCFKIQQRFDLNRYKKPTEYTLLFI